MYYKKVEEYNFKAPQEYKAYLAFAARLKEMGVKYTDRNQGMFCTITIFNNGDFEVDDKCDILKLVKAE